VGIDQGRSQRTSSERYETGKVARDLIATRRALGIARGRLHTLEGARLWRWVQLAAGFIGARPWLRRGLRFAAATAARVLRDRKDAPSPDAKAIIESGLFDSAWYSARNPGAPREPMAAAAHYLSRKAKQPIDPGPAFDAAWYHARNPDVGEGNPLLHYLSVGRHRLRAISQTAHEAAEAARRRALGLDMPPPSQRIAIGFTPGGDADRALRSARIAAEFAGISESCRFLWPGEAPAGAVRVDVAPHAGMAPVVHNDMLRTAAALGASLYLAADTRGFFAPDCLTALLRMSAASDDRALIAAMDFPHEHPRIPDPLTFRTGWAGGGCLLMPVGEVLRIGGFAPGLERLAAIDLSWRARQAGLEIKTCPAALYVGTPPASGLEDWVSLDLLREGHLLARLFGATVAEETIAAELRRAGVPLAELPPDNLARDPACADWAHGFGFAPARW
jgi:hypothetical protein